MKTQRRVLKTMYLAVILTIVYVQCPSSVKADLPGVPEVGPAACIAGCVDQFSVSSSLPSSQGTAPVTPSLSSLSPPSTDTSSVDLSTLFSYISGVSSFGQYTSAIGPGFTALPNSSPIPNQFGSPVLSGTPTQIGFGGIGTATTLIPGAMNIYSAVTNPSLTTGQQQAAGIGATSDLLLQLGVPALGAGAATFLGAPALLAGGIGLAGGLAYNYFGSPLFNQTYTDLFVTSQQQSSQSQGGPTIQQLTTITDLSGIPVLPSSSQ